MPAIFSADPAIRRSGVPKSGRSISARIRPATQNRWMCVNKASSPSTATISNCSFCEPCAMRSGRVCSRRNSTPTPNTTAIRKIAMTTMNVSVSPGAVMKPGR